MGDCSTLFPGIDAWDSYNYISSQEVPVTYVPNLGTFWFHIASVWANVCNYTVAKYLSVLYH